MLASCGAAGQPLQLPQQIRPTHLPGFLQHFPSDQPQPVIRIDRLALGSGRCRQVRRYSLELRAQLGPVAFVQFKGQIHRPLAYGSTNTQHDVYLLTVRHTCSHRLARIPMHNRKGLSRKATD